MMGSHMTRDEVEQTLGRVKSWPFERQAKLAELVELIEAQAPGAMLEDDATRVAIAEGLAQARRGEFADFPSLVLKKRN